MKKNVCQWGYTECHMKMEKRSGNSVGLQYTKNSSFDDQWNISLIIRVNDWHIPFVVTMDIDTNMINKRTGDEIIKKFDLK